MRLIQLLVVCAATLLAGCMTAPPPPPSSLTRGDGRIRVLLARLGAGAKLQPDPGLTATAIAGDVGALRYDGPGSLRVGEQVFPAPVEVWPQGNGWLVIVSLQLERYLAGVLGGEMPLAWPQAALRAQAIASRSYAVWRRAVAPIDQPYDVTATTASQVFVAGKMDDPRAVQAVEGTRDLVLVWDGKVLPAFFHSTCGGHTAPAAAVLSGEAPDIPPLAGAVCGFCEPSKYHRWEAVRLPETKLRTAAEKLGGRTLGPLTAIVPQAGIDGHATTLRCTGAQGEATIPATAFRLAVGPSELRSTAFQAQRVGEDFEFSGRGWGHGAGLCQWGARGMALAEMDERAILARYYPGAVLLPLP